jgi:hypothetical protein
MYQTDFLCTYKLLSNDKDLNDDDAECLYQLQLLQAFDIPVWNDSTVDEALKLLYEKLREFPVILEIFAKAKTCPLICQTLAMFLDLDQVNAQSITDEEVLQMLFKYEYFDIWHKCIVELLHYGALHANTLHTMLALLA